jgi:uncharacterized protein (DUF983 family)
MIDALNSQSSAQTEEVLHLKCPACGGGLNLKRRFLGVTGQCAHCQISLTAVEEGGGARIIAESIPAPTVETPVMTSEQEPVLPEKAHTVVSHGAVPQFPRPFLTSGIEEPASSWGFPEYDPSPTAVTAPKEPDFMNFGAPDSPSLPNWEADDLFSGRQELPAMNPPTGEKGAEASPFGDLVEFPLASSLFGSDNGNTEFALDWVTNLPRETHASVPPFSTGSAEKVTKDDAFADSGSFGSPFVTMSCPKPSEEITGAEGPKRDSQVGVILDGDGRPMPPMSKKEEEEFAKNFLNYSNARTEQTWLTRLRKAAIRLLVFLCIVGAVGAGASFFVPKETLIVWKEKVIKSLEPGMVILDYLPTSLRPDWLPQTEFGIDAGVDQNDQPKKKMNAFEGLDKLKGDVGKMRGAADKQLEELKDF